MDDPTLDYASPGTGASDTADSVDVLKLLLNIVQALLAAYLVFAFVVSPPSMGTFASGPVVGRLALAWRDHGMIYAQVVVTILSIAAVAGIGGERRYARFTRVAVGHFCLTLLSFAVLANVTVLTTGGSTRAFDRVRIDWDWPVVVPAWFLFCNPVLILVAVRAVLRTNARASAPPRG